MGRYRAATRPNQHKLLERAGLIVTNAAEARGRFRIRSTGLVTAAFGPHPTSLVANQEHRLLGPFVRLAPPFNPQRNRLRTPTPSAHPTDCNRLRPVGTCSFAGIGLRLSYFSTGFMKH